jgi:hypothetical protein
MIRTMTGAGVALNLFLLPGCGDCENEQAAARQFIETHQSCEVDEDCVVVGTGCFTIPSGLCSQAIMSREASRSVEWSEIHGDLLDCENECVAVCGAALNAGPCVENSCGGGS